jgi:hypothetical protein
VCGPAVALLEVRALISYSENSFLSVLFRSLL